jgi:hypothetical protein
VYAGLKSPTVLRLDCDKLFTTGYWTPSRCRLSSSIEYSEHRPVEAQLIQLCSKAVSGWNDPAADSFRGFDEVCLPLGLFVFRSTGCSSNIPLHTVLEKCIRESMDISIDFCVLKPLSYDFQLGSRRHYGRLSSRSA